MLRRIRPHVEGICDELEPESAGELPAECFIAIRSRSEAVIEMYGSDDGEIAMRRQLAQNERQRDRVGASGESDEHTRTGRTQIVPADGAADLLKDAGQWAAVHLR